MNPIWQSVLGILAALALWYSKDIIRKILQYAEDNKKKEETAKNVSESVALNQKQNLESDKLREIDGR